MRHSHVIGVGLGLAIAACGGDGGGDDGTTDPPYVPPYVDCAGTTTTPVTPPDGSLCLVDPVAPIDAPPIAVIEHELVTYENVPAVHISLIFDPAFVDNTYGVNAVGWDRHTFRDLVGSDHAQVIVLGADGSVVFDLELDYISEDPDAPCGYSCLGIAGGEGGVNVGDPAAILGWTSSLDRNLNELGYCYTTDSPATDAACTDNPEAPGWDFRVIYEVWIALSAFDPIGFGSAYMSFVHASPAKGGDNTVEIEPGECPCPEIDPGDCMPSGPPGNCTTNEDCSAEEFCYSGSCLPIVE